MSVNRRRNGAGMGMGATGEGASGKAGAERHPGWRSWIGSAGGMLGTILMRAKPCAMPLRESRRAAENLTTRKDSQMERKVLALSASPRKGGNSDPLCDQFVRGARAAGNRAEKIFLRDKRINYCTGVASAWRRALASRRTTWPRSSGK